MESPRNQFFTVGVPKESREKLKKIARAQKRFNYEVLRELIDKQFSDIVKTRKKI